MRTRCLLVFLLTAGIGFSQVSSKQAGGCISCFSEPNSTLFFGPLGGKTNLPDFGPPSIDTNLGEYTLVTPNGNLTLPLPFGSGSMGLVSSDWATSLSGDLVAGGLQFLLNADVVKCDPSQKNWCDPKPKPIVKSVLGVYSVRDKTWKQYGDFQIVGSAAFSPDAKRIAFYEDKVCTVDPCDRGLMILDLDTGQMGTIPGSIQISWRDQLSWSPDSKFLAVSAYGHGPQDVPSVGQIVVIDSSTGAKKVIAEGTNPSWSPKGDWIAYQFYVKCMIIHPDGTGARSVLDKEPKWMNYTFDGPLLWSPDGERLLINQQQIYGGHTRAIMVDLATGHAVMKSKNPKVAVMGWVPSSGN